MGSKSYTITVNAPEGFEFTGEVRTAKEGEYYAYFSGDGRLEATKSDLGTSYEYPILAIKKIEGFKWPSWLKAGYIAKNENGRYYAHEKVPTLFSYHWSNGGNSAPLDECNFEIGLPKDVPWKHSLIKNPNIKE